MELMYTMLGCTGLKPQKIVSLDWFWFCLFVFFISPAVTESKHNDLISDQSVTMN